MNEVLFDKTGTLTVGQPCVAECVVLPQSISVAAAAEVSVAASAEPSSPPAVNTRIQASVSSGVATSFNDQQRTAMWLAACAELGSEHTLGTAIVTMGRTFEAKFGQTLQVFGIVPTN